MPVEVSVAPMVSDAPDRVTPAAVMALERLMEPLLVNDRAPVNVSEAVVLTLPAFVKVKLLILESEPIASVAVPLLRVTLLVAPVAVEPVTASAPTALVPVRLTVEVLLEAALARVALRFEAVTAPAPLIT